jgi:hypothetical protein
MITIHATNTRGPWAYKLADRLTINGYTVGLIFSDDVPEVITTTTDSEALAVVSCRAEMEDAQPTQEG